ncbi:YlaH-like family protein [Paenibacillus sp. GCM10012307]|uniref:YlaH-like family protein n=1 Tax=Paenibacillus roseus TaxID=2798579 RepID=A0A934J5B4_9BACL|nr:YlaH-like family protein [Paenibacillus roseus]MBJ6363135.1 YlaH-like family protein [Paenibacillus roseus]
MQAWLSNHPLVSYVLILGSVVYIFNKVFRAQRRLPILKEILVYLMMALGSLVLLVLQIDKLPIIQCMAVAIALMLILRARQLYDKWKGNTKPAGQEPEAKS